MVEFVFATIFVIIVFIIGILSKKVLYVNEHELSIENELKIFRDNFKTIDDIDKVSDFKLGNKHLYK